MTDANCIIDAANTKTDNSIHIDFQYLVTPTKGRLNILVLRTLLRQHNLTISVIRMFDLRFVLVFIGFILLNIA
jgi:hypothetical protein